MVKRKGLSPDEKRERVLKIFHEKKEVFQLKEVEKIASKEKGVVIQTVKDILKELVEDNLVDSDKVGTSVYFWAFPGKVSRQRKSSRVELRGTLKKLHQVQAEIQRKVEEKQHATNEEGDITNLVSELESLRNTNEDLEVRYRELLQNDPAILDKLKQEVQDLKSAINQWTDNLYNTRSWVKKKFGKTEEEVNRMFNIPGDLDYVE